MDLEDALRRLADDGYVILERLLSHAELDELRGALEPLEDGRPMGRNDFEGERSSYRHDKTSDRATADRVLERPKAIL